ncbi:MAG: flagellar basal body rod protein FlgB [Mariprofundales bacterium]|nr:flagellar basal body rod protein FlgB [Mariprofundales bacterium]
MGSGLFGGTFARLEAGVTAREHLQSVISGNIANSDTPNYKADTRTFADFLAASQQTESPVALRTSNSRHMDIKSGSHHLDLGGIFHRDDSVNTRMDGNSVDLQQEMVKMAENQMLHDLSIKLLKGKLSGMRNAIREGR